MKTKENSNLRKNLLSYLDEIKKDYLGGMRIEGLSEKYSASTATIRRFLTENNINKGRRNLKDPEIIDKLKEEICKLLPYNTVTAICKKLNINHTKYVEIMNLESNAKQFKNGINEDFVNLDNPDFCYFLGIFMADGHFDQKSIYLSQSNASYLHKIQKLLGHKGKLYKDARSKNPNYKLTISSNKLRNLLEQYKIESNKKFSAPYINCGKYSRDFVRGVLDGDGCIYYKYISGSFKAV